MKYFFALTCCFGMSVSGMSCERVVIEGDPLPRFAAQVIELRQRGESVQAVTMVCRRVFEESDERSLLHAQHAFEKLIPLLLDLEHPDAKNMALAVLVLSFITSTKSNDDPISWEKEQFCRIIDAFCGVDGFLLPQVWDLVQSLPDAKWKQWAYYTIGSRLLDYAQE